MNTVDVKEYIHKVMDTAVGGAIRSNNYVLWFRDDKQEIHAYDTVDPIRGSTAILGKNPTFQLVQLDRMPDANSARAAVTIARKARELRADLPLHTEPNAG